MPPPNRPIVVLLPLLLCMAMGRAAAAEDMFLYTVQPGDSAWTVTARYLREQDHWQQLRQSNRLRGDRLLPGQVLRIPIPWLRVTTQEARLSAIEGEVMLDSGAGWTAARADTVLAPGTWLRTPPDGTATLLVQDGTRVLVRPSSELRLMALDQAQLGAWVASGAAQTRPPATAPMHIELLRGGLENAVQPQAGQSRFEVHTPSAVTTVRGTEFRVSTDETGSRAEVLHGAIGFHNPRGQVELPAAMGSRAVHDTPPIDAVPLLQAPEVGAIPDRLTPEQARTHRTPAITGAAAYRVQWFSDDTSPRLLHESVTDTPMLSFPADRPDGAYRMRLRAIDAIGLEGLSAEHALVVKTPPPASPPPPPPPWLKVARHGRRLELSWGPAEPEASAQVQIARDAAFNAVLLDEPTPHPTLNLPLPPSGPEPGHARIRVLRADGSISPWSEPQRIDSATDRGPRP
jgi:hypothetical protein